MSNAGGREKSVGIRWLDSRLSVARSCSPFGVRGAAAAVEPREGLIQLFRFIHTPDFYRFITNHFI